MEVKAFKLKSGEELIAETEAVMQGDKVSYKITNPLTPTIDSLSEWFMFSKDRVFTLQEDDLLVSPADVHDGLAQMYAEKFGHILTPPKSEIIIR